MKDGSLELLEKVGAVFFRGVRVGRYLDVKERLFRGVLGGFFGSSCRSLSRSAWGPARPDSCDMEKVPGPCSFEVSE